jgi:hypothetical protein
MPEASELLVIPLLLLLLALVALQIWATARWDRRRIRSYIAARGGEVQSIKYRHFGNGWLAQENTRAYAVRYTDGKGISHQATCRTAWLGGVYFTEDIVDGPACPKIIVRKPPNALVLESDTGKIHALERENEALREELTRLRRKK